MSSKHNFSAGPCILPQEVFQEASEAVKNFNNTGLSIIEMSHRSPEFVAVMEEARALVKEVLSVPDNYTVLFLQGGASTGFLTTAYNMMRANKKAGFIETGAWAKKAVKEANFMGSAEVVASSADRNYCYIPKGFDIPADLDYMHLTSNNTIFGTQFKEFPATNIPLVCDMSSDIFSKPVDVTRFDIIYAGAQKNLGPAGTTLYIVKNDVFGASSVEIPTMLNLKTHADKDSMFNTPPCFAVYVSMLTLRWLKNNGGLSWMTQRNEEKAQLLYTEIDNNPLFTGTADKEDRSNMNVTFIMTDETHKDEFDKMWNEAGISGIKGHRSVGGYRASIYNAMPVESVKLLANLMKEFANQYATAGV